MDEEMTGKGMQNMGGDPKGFHTVGPPSPLVGDTKIFLVVKPI